MTSRQVAYRLFYLFRRRWWQLTAKKAPIPFASRLKNVEPLLMGIDAAAEPGPWEEEVELALDRARMLSQHRFCFFNQEISYPKKILWHDSHASQLWRYHLHYFDYVEDLLLWHFVEPAEKAWRTFRNLVDSWISGNAILVGDGWHPFTISVRVVNWIHAYVFWNDRFTSNPDFFDRFRQSLFGQLHILATSLEHDVRGNHLLKNLRALIIAGLIFDNKSVRAWGFRATKHLKHELTEQVLDDGGHFERVPGYHLAVLKDCLEIALWLRRGLLGVSYPWLNIALERMLGYAKAILPPDGQMPLLKDTAWNAGPTATDLLAAGAIYFDNPTYKISEHYGLYPFFLFGGQGWRRYQGWPINSTKSKSISLTQSGYHILRDDAAGDYLIFDTGKVCPDYLPAHAHADLLSYELMVKGKRLVVDSGTYEYTAGPWRDYFRSTRAHNTVVVEKQNQSEVWASFRVARRARPSEVYQEKNDNYFMVGASHNGYKRLPVPVIHRRILLWVKGRFWLVVDELRGKGAVQADSPVHFHPDIEVKTINDNNWQLNGLSSSLRIQSFGVDHGSIIRGQSAPCIQGWYSAQFGKRRPNTVLTFPIKGELSLCFGYVLSHDTNIDVEADPDSGKNDRHIHIKDSRGISRLHLDSRTIRYFS